VVPQTVAKVASRLFALGCYEISLGDTIGSGTPIKARKLIERVGAQIPIEHLALHFHDTYGRALANILACIELGVSVIDSAVAGLGGCPYAEGASGNVATEDVVYMLRGMDVETGVDLDALAEAGRTISPLLDREPASKVARALAGRPKGRQ
jgi:hydroxymethylglutaryl-CoA lyase